MKVAGSTRAAALAVATTAFVGSMTGIAWAPKNLSVQVIEADCGVKDAGSGSFLGAVTLTGFTMAKDQLAGVATVTGTCTLANGTKVVLPAGTTVVVPLSIQELSCHELELTLGDVAIASAAMTLETGGLHLFLSPGSRGDQARFCAAERLARTRPLQEMLTPLGQLLFQ